MIVASGGIGGNHNLVRQNWPKRLGEPPKNMISGVPEHVDGRMIGITEEAGARLINRDRMWHYVRGYQELVADLAAARYPFPSCPDRRRCGSTRQASGFPRRCFPAPTRLASCNIIMSTGHDYSWFVLTQSIIKKEFALSGSEQNPESDGKKLADDRAPRHQQGRAGAGRGVQEQGRGFHCA